MADEDRGGHNYEAIFAKFRFRVVVFEKCIMFTCVLLFTLFAFLLALERVFRSVGAAIKL